MRNTDINKELDKAVNKAVEIINTADDECINVSEPVEPVITASDIAKASKDIENSLGIKNHMDNNQDNNSTHNSDNNIYNNTSKNAKYNSNIPDDIIDDKKCRFSNIPKEELLELASKGGRQAAINNKKRKTAQNILQKLLATEMNEKTINEVLGDAKAILGEEKTVYAVMLTKMIQIACAGDVKAFVALRDTAGDKPVEEQLITADIMTDTDRRLIENLKKRITKDAPEISDIG